jgi:hypothetical protein
VSHYLDTKNNFKIDIEDPFAQDSGSLFTKKQTLPLDMSGILRAEDAKTAGDSADRGARPPGVRRSEADLNFDDHISVKDGLRDSSDAYDPFVLPRFQPLSFKIDQNNSQEEDVSPIRNKPPEDTGLGRGLDSDALGELEGSLAAERKRGVRKRPTGVITADMFDGPDLEQRA